ncbi:uncharacterized protein LOC120761145 [Hirundo rustica]|uniref:uncharacterized protein LOC120761145 n=1 Tax=Hirundo rustica TaxID=43150 RepID=UPI001A952353|nr:uncharacterized protein LOC120761145 [Hirundo rustica]
MWHGARVMGGQPMENPPTSPLTAKGTGPWSRASCPATTTSLPSTANSSSYPRRSSGVSQTPQTSFVEKVCIFEAPCPGFAGQGDVCPEFGETEAETAEKVCLELCKKPRVKYTNNLPQLSPALGSSRSCPQLPEEQICTGSYPGGRKAQSLGSSHAFHNPPCPRGLQQRPGALGARAGPDFGVPLPHGSPGGGVQRTCLCCKMSCSVSLRGTQLLHMPARSAASAGSHPGTGTGGGCAPPKSISFSIAPTAEGTCLKVEPEIARLALHRGWQGCELGRGTGTDCSSGNFPGSSCGSGRCGDGAVSMQTQPPDCGSAPLSPVRLGLNRGPAQSRRGQR